MAAGIKIKIVGDKTVRASSELLLLQHRMPAIHDLQLAGSFIEFGTAIAPVLRDELFAIAAQVAQIIQFSVNTLLNDAAVSQGKRRTGDNRLLNAAAQVAEFIQQHI